tara:strand:+ start:230 stop:421 length:192 start_codon:yes stop_codon:yes gene_type:complete
MNELFELFVLFCACIFLSFFCLKILVVPKHFDFKKFNESASLESNQYQYFFIDDQAKDDLKKH